MDIYCISEFKNKILYTMQLQHKHVIILTFNIIAFSVHRSSVGNELACQRSLSSGFDKYSVNAISDLY